MLHYSLSPKFALIATLPCVANVRRSFSITTRELTQAVMIPAVAGAAAAPTAPAESIIQKKEPPTASSSRCAPPVPVEGTNDTFHVSCLSPGVPLKPGQARCIACLFHAESTSESSPEYMGAALEFGAQTCDSPVLCYTSAFSHAHHCLKKPKTVCSTQSLLPHLLAGVRAPN